MSFYQRGVDVKTNMVYSKAPATIRNTLFEKHPHQCIELQHSKEDGGFAFVRRGCEAVID